jgi:hypothetical protein
MQDHTLWWTELYIWTKQHSSLHHRYSLAWCQTMGKKNQMPSPATACRCLSPSATNRRSSQVWSESDGISPFCVCLWWLFTHSNVPPLLTKPTMRSPMHLDGTIYGAVWNLCALAGHPPSHHFGNQLIKHQLADWRCYSLFSAAIVVVRHSRSKCALTITSLRRFRSCIWHHEQFH